MSELREIRCGLLVRALVLEGASVFGPQGPALTAEEHALLPSPKTQLQGALDELQRTINMNQPENVVLFFLPPDRQVAHG